MRAVPPNEIRKFYTKRANRYHMLCVNILGWGRIIKNCLADNDGFVRSGLKILDAGCGTGAVTRALYSIARRQRKTGLLYHAFDLTPAMLAVFEQWRQKNLATDIKIRQGNVLELDKFPVGWNNYDRIVTAGMLEHLSRDNMVKALSNLRKLLKPNHGKIMIFVSRRSQFIKPISRYVEWWWKINTYNNTKLWNIVHDAGFNDIKITKAGLGCLAVIEAKNLQRPELTTDSKELPLTDTQL